MSQFFASGGQSIRASASASVLPVNIQDWVSFRMDGLDLLAVQGTHKSLFQHHSSKASVLWCSAFFIVQLSHPYMTTGKTITLTRWTFVSKVMSLVFNMLSRLIIAFLPRRKCLLISWLKLPSAVIWEPQKTKSVSVSIVFPYICHEMMGPDTMILVFWMLYFKLTFPLSCFTFIKRLFSSSSLSAIRVMSSVYLRLLIFLPAILIPACASSSPAFRMTHSEYKLNKQGDSIQPWSTPFPIWNQSVVPCLVLTVASWPTYRFLRRQVRWSGIPTSLRIFQFVVIHTVKGFGVVNKAKVDVFLELSCFLMIQQMLAIWSLVPLLFLIQLEHLEVHGSCTVEAWLGEFWALLC